MSSSTRAINSMLPLFLGMSLLFIGNGLVISSGSVELKRIGTSEVMIGAINTCFFIGAMISTMTSHLIVLRAGHIRAFAIFSAIFSLSAMFHSLSMNLYFWAILRALLGFCYYALLMVIESWLNSKTPNRIRSRILAFYEAVFYINFGLGILILSLELKTFEVFIIGAAFLMLSTIPLYLIRIKEPPLPPRQSVSMPKIFTIVPLALVGSVIAGVLINGFFSMSSVFIMLQGYGAKEVSFFMTIAMFGGFCAQFFIGKLSDKFGRRPAIIFSCTIAFVSALAFLFSTNLKVQYGLAFCLGMGIFCLYGLSIARANDALTDRSKSVEVSRALLFSYSSGSLISPLVMGASMDMFGTFGFIYVYLTLSLVLLVFAFTKETIPVELRKSYHPHVSRTIAIDGLNTTDNFTDMENKK
ncbi:MFS transporter [Campylobacter sp. faydin G-140]|uniref:MFS transporter n=1 Tax=Campylobacter anatolicus TaxID=2829105 RepID=UPI001B9F3367|nr:MFS transporter [Campylobacter anatolicus]MBR8461971.1 MFS transporter [Campylobacter anatolicus]MBR8464940.1 MFS transporter [Campylobacter anatolicus]